MIPFTFTAASLGAILWVPIQQVGREERELVEIWVATEVRTAPGVITLERVQGRNFGFSFGSARFDV